LQSDELLSAANSHSLDELLSAANSYSFFIHFVHRVTWLDDDSNAVWRRRAVHNLSLDVDAALPEYLFNFSDVRIIESRTLRIMAARGVPMNPLVLCLIILPEWYFRRPFYATPFCSELFELFLADLIPWMSTAFGCITAMRFEWPFTIYTAFEWLAFLAFEER
jgi:hypothetical protein